MTDVEKYKDDLTTHLLSVCTGNGLLKGTLLSTPDIDEAWVRLAPSFYGDAVREFNHYPEFCLGCAGYLGMAIAFLWDADWARYAEVPYAFFQREGRRREFSPQSSVFSFYIFRKNFSTAGRRNRTREVETILKADPLSGYERLRPRG